MNTVRRTVSLSPEVDAFVRSRWAREVRQGLPRPSYSAALNALIEECMEATPGTYAGVAAIARVTLDLPNGS